MKFIDGPQDDFGGLIIRMSAAGRVHCYGGDTGRLLAARIDWLERWTGQRWKIHAECAANGTIAARVEPDLVHHSDRGSCTSLDYTEVAIKRRGIEISMSRKGPCAAACESFMKTLKYEEVHRNGISGIWRK